MKTIIFFSILCLLLIIPLASSAIKQNLNSRNLQTNDCSTNICYTDASGISQDCPAGCSACSLVDSNVVCSECDSTHWLNSLTGLCDEINVCGFNGYNNRTINQCFTCPRTCSACTYNSSNKENKNITCSSCAGDAILNETLGNCENPSCSSSTYFSLSDLLCHDCPTDCTSCEYDSTKTSGASCTLCSSVKFLNNVTGTCDQIPTCNTSAYYNSSNNSCNKCPDSCSSCEANSDNSGIICSGCPNNSFWYNSVEGSCDVVPVCDSGNYYNSSDNQCYNCSSNCSLCHYDSNNTINNNISCTLCQNSFLNISQNTCKEIPVCVNGTYYNSSDNTCNNCTENCTICAANSNNSEVVCSECKLGLSLNNASGSCEVVSVCDSGNYYNSSDNLCHNCTGNCTLCQYDSSNTINNNVSCTECKTNAFLNVSQHTCDIVPQCSVGFYYNSSNNSCNGCPSNCTKCVMDVNNVANNNVTCTNCTVGFFNDTTKGSCDAVPSCQNKTYYNSSDNTCNDCPFNCSSCVHNNTNLFNNFTTCSLCGDGAFLDIAHGSCDPVPVCSNGTYYNSSDNTCNNCTENCTICAANSNNSEVVCSECKLGLSLNVASGSCEVVSVCDSGNYYNSSDNLCHNCTGNCTLCQYDSSNTINNNVSCTECQTNAFLNVSQHTCDVVPQCSVGFYYNSSDNSCNGCPSNCTECVMDVNNVANNNVTCTNCTVGFFNDTTKGSCDAVPSCQNKTYYNSSDNTCNDCPFNCSSCVHNNTNLFNNFTTCTVCAEGSFNNSAHGSCDSVPVCVNGTYYNSSDNTCNNCTENCTICAANSNNSEVVCSECKVGSWYDALLSSCEGVPVCDNSTYYNSSDNLCYNCTSNCTLCQYDSSNTLNNNVTCTECKIDAWYDFQFGTCEPVPFCPDGTYYNSTNNTCGICPNNCTLCSANNSNGGINCTSCQIDTWHNLVNASCDVVPLCANATYYNISENTCNECPSYCTECSLNETLTCQACNSTGWFDALTDLCDLRNICTVGGYYNESINQCFSCPDNCSECQYDDNNTDHNNITCNSCNNISWYDLLNGTCDAVPVCDEGTYYNSKNNTCVPCPKNCSNCSYDENNTANNNITCNSCNNISWYDLLNGTCDGVSVCFNGTYYNSINNTCDACPANCSTCSYDENNTANNNISCHSCNNISWYDLLNGTCDIVPACENGSYYNKTDNTCNGCPSNCTSCVEDLNNTFNNNVTCSVCASGSWQNLVNGSCDAIPLCNNGSYYNSSDNTCNPCLANCTKCVLDTNNSLNEFITCTECAAGSFLNETEGNCDPIPICSNGSYYKELNHSCFKCPNYCDVCTYNASNELNNNVTCSVCKVTGWFNSISEGCDKKKNCTNGTYFNNSNNSCPICPLYCSDCVYNETNVEDNNVTCLNCNGKGWYNVSERICDQKANCTQGTYFNNSENTCLFCPFHCSDCHYDENNTNNYNISCSACKDNAFFNNTSLFCQLRSICHDGLYYDPIDNWCYDCPENCTDCTYDNQNLFNNNVTCFGCENDSYYDVSHSSCEGIPVCDNGTYYNETDNLCYSCPHSCNNCSANASNITHQGVTCYGCDSSAWYNPKSLICTPRGNCGGNTYFNQTEDTCLFCPYYCTSCNYDETNPSYNYITCLSCREDGFLNSTLGGCEMRSRCHDGSYYNKFDNSCYDCPDECAKCVYDKSNVNNVTCIKCENEWHYVLTESGRCVNKHD